MDMLVHPVSESSATHVPPVVADLQHDNWTWVVGGALFCLLLIARLTGGVPVSSGSGTLPPAAMAVPATVPPAPASHLQHIVSRI